MALSNYPKPEPEEYIPDDDFAHKPGMDCQCGPETKYVPGLGGGIVHRRILVSDTPVPDYPPE